MSMTYAQFQQDIGHATAICRDNNLVDITVGYHPCTIWFYVLPNGTLVNVYRGTPAGSKNLRVKPSTPNSLTGRNPFSLHFSNFYNSAVST